VCEKRHGFVPPAAIMLLAAGSGNAARVNCRSNAGEGEVKWFGFQRDDKE